MAGRGRLGEVPAIENKQLLMLRNGRWWPLSEPVNYDRPFAGVSLATSFADEYAKKFECETGLIPCADGGTSLDEWACGGQLYTHAVYQIRLAQKISEVKGILWHQGENDSGDIKNAETYRDRFIKMITALRRDCGLENVPLILGELGSFLINYPGLENGYFKIVNKQLAEIAETCPHTGLASAEGLTDNGDNMHFNAVSLREFGRRYFEKYLEITVKPWGPFKE
ncbi:acetylxylan esterase [Spirochaetia bacterium]|nr:acetylxylan esterase [Spirochaetia bacterium]